jgi:hypothetical protein
MAYRIFQLARGSYDIDLDGEVIGSLVHLAPMRHRPASWVAELLSDDGQRPPPFVSAEHEFQAFGDVLAWLGDPHVTRPHQVTSPIRRLGPSLDSSGS